MTAMPARPPSAVLPHLTRVSMLSVLVLLGSVLAPSAGRAQDSNILYPVDYIMERLLAPSFEILDIERARVLETDRSRRVTLAGADGEPPLEVHLKPVGLGAEGFNNEPRYELAAFEFQQLFLSEEEYVVPPVVLRAMALEEYVQFYPSATPTIRRTQSVLFLLSYWVQNLGVDTVDPFNIELFNRDPTYARHWANMNTLTHLIDHKDANHGNVLISLDGLNRRVFTVDNDVSFRSNVSERGDRWRRLQVTTLSAATIERLRPITRSQLEERLAVLAEFEIVDGLLHPIDRGPNLDARQGVRVKDGRVQLGLTSREIGDLETRISRLLREVDSGKITTF